MCLLLWSPSVVAGLAGLAAAERDGVGHDVPAAAHRRGLGAAVPGRHVMRPAAVLSQAVSGDVPHTDIHGLHRPGLPAGFRHGDHYGLRHGSRRSRSHCDYVALELLPGPALRLLQVDVHLLRRGFVTP
ncbi:unnamed protein product [Chrysodeixis includens]|uniref:Secreted protein n=1 Tax=Chrysodeixis includens TaxID=689277 RepID=A0A9N8PZ10_CHRIL|nr:unnamed protein product [Chrysodeixis includens]